VVIFHRGDIVLCDLNPVIGSEQSGIRPVVIIQIDRANAISPHTIIVPLTTKIRRAILDSHFLLRQGTAGLDRDSVVLCEQVRAIDKRRVIRLIGNLNTNELAGIEKALRVIQGL
jgi:mRNA interferase MazF